MTREFTVWSIEGVAARFEEAVVTGRRLPPVRVQGYINLWPPIVRQEWERYADDRKMIRFPPDPAAIDRMLETMGWVQWLTVERRHLVWMRAGSVEWAEISKRFACNRTTAWRHWNLAMQTVADNLNQSLAPNSKQVSQKG